MSVEGASEQRPQDGREPLTPSESLLQTEKFGQCLKNHDLGPRLHLFPRDPGKDAVRGPEKLSEERRAHTSLEADVG